MLFVAALVILAQILMAQENESNSIQLQVACGYAGTTSPDITAIKVLVESKNHLFIKKALFSKNAIEALLSAIVLKVLQQKGAVTLTAGELRKMSEICTSTTNYSVCDTCTQHFQGTVKQLFSDNGVQVRSLLKNAIFTK